MARISDVKLKISDGATPDERLLTVTYQVHFGAKEVNAGSAFVEVIRLYGDDRREGGGVESLKLLRRKLMLATRLGQGWHSIKRSVPVSKQTLNEDDPSDPGDPWGWDELFVRVWVRLFVPGSAVEDSPTVVCQFGD